MEHVGTDGVATVLQFLSIREGARLCRMSRCFRNSVRHALRQHRHVELLSSVEDAGAPRRSRTLALLGKLKRPTYRSASSRRLSWRATTPLVLRRTIAGARHAAHDRLTDEERDESILDVTLRFHIARHRHPPTPAPLRFLVDMCAPKLIKSLYLELCHSDYDALQEVAPEPARTFPAVASLVVQCCRVRRSHVRYLLKWSQLDKLHLVSGPEEPTTALRKLHTLYTFKVIFHFHKRSSFSRTHLRGIVRSLPSTVREVLIGRPTPSIKHTLTELLEERFGKMEAIE